jgi:hypothetical protein
MRHITYTEKPDFVPDFVYSEAKAAKYHYNASWEFWVAEVAREYNCSQAMAEDACIRGIKKALARIGHVYGGQVAKWYEEFLDMSDIFTKVKHPEYTKKLEGV